MQLDRGSRRASNEPSLEGSDEHTSAHEESSWRVIQPGTPSLLCFSVLFLLTSKHLLPFCASGERVSSHGVPLLRLLRLGWLTSSQ